MRSRLSLIVWLSAVLLFAPGTVFAQTFQEAGLYCTAGLVPDGYIDFTGMPPAPTLSPGTTSVPVTATLPVHGVPGLTVSVTIPSLTAFGGSSGPLYTVNGGSLQLNALPASNASTPTILVLNFSQSINGVGLDMETTGRFTYNYTLQVGTTPSEGPVTFATTASGYTLAFQEPEAQSLQIVGLNTPFPTAAVLFSGDEFYNGITLSNIRVRSASAPDLSKAVPTNGLQQWLRADTANTFGGTWKDQSGTGHDATPGTVPPQFTVGGHNCQPTYAFAGNAYFDFNLPIAGWTQMTVFMVARAATNPPAGSYYSDNSAMLWTENQFWGNTFVSPYQTNVSARFGTTQVGNNLFYVRPGGGIGQDFTSTRAVHDNGADTVYVNGRRVFRQTGKLSALGGVSGAGTIGEGINHTFFNGDISEILIYNRVLSAEEATAVEDYLAQKYGLH
jgi:Concanavalin A-like lectin/glucanases superfamily